MATTTENRLIPTADRIEVVATEGVVADVLGEEVGPVFPVIDGLGFLEGSGDGSTPGLFGSIPRRVQRLSSYL